jgi:hypothetical protein
MARVVTNPNPNSTHYNEIQLQYWKPTSFKHIDADTSTR